MYGGKECEGGDKKIESCNEQPCPGILQYHLWFDHFV